MLIEDDRAWDDNDQANLEAQAAEFEKEHILKVCEDCMNLLWLEGNATWLHDTCDICGSTEDYCCNFTEDEGIKSGDPYANDPTVEKDMIVCDTCATNWKDNWGALCQKCLRGNPVKQEIEDMDTMARNAMDRDNSEFVVTSRVHVSGETYRACDECGVVWDDMSRTTCAHCGGDTIVYRSVPGVPARVVESAFEPVRTYVPNHETGRLELKERVREDLIEDNPSLFESRG